MQGWYLLYCKPRDEQRAQQNLKLQGIDTYLPMCQERKRTKKANQASQAVVKTVPLFPNYIFAKFDPEQTSLSTINSTRGVSYVVGSKERNMIPLDHVVFAIRRKEQELGILDFYQPIVPVPEMPLNEETVTKNHQYQQGDKVEFIDHTFGEVEAVSEQDNGKERCFVLLNLLGKMTKALVQKSQIKPLS